MRCWQAEKDLKEQVEHESVVPWQPGWKNLFLGASSTGGASRGPNMSSGASGTALPTRAAVTTHGRGHIVMVSSHQAEQRSWTRSEVSCAFVLKACLYSNNQTTI